MDDNLTNELDRTLKKNERRANAFAKNFGRNFSNASLGVVAGVKAVTLGVGRFLGNISRADYELEQYAETLGKTKEEAFAMKTALDTMGKTMEEVNNSASLQRVFNRLQEDAKNLKPPDMSEGLEQVRGIQEEFSRLRHTGMYATRWIGYYLTKYLHNPMERLRNTISNGNDFLIKNISKWTRIIASGLASIVSLGATVFRIIINLGKAIKAVFNMIPKEIKILMGALTALALFIRAGPVGKLMAIFTVLLLLVEDFFVYLDGGEALLGGLWQKIIDVFNYLKNSGAIDRFKENFQNALDFIGDKVLSLKDYLINLFNLFMESDSIENFIALFSNFKELLSALSVPIKLIGQSLLNTFSDGSKGFLEWIISDVLPGMILALSNIVGGIASVITTLNEMGLTVPIIKGLVIAFLGFKAIRTIPKLIDGVINKTNKLSTAIDKINNSKKGLGRFGKLKKSLGKLFGGTKKLFINLFKGIKIGFALISKVVLVAIKGIAIGLKVLLLPKTFIIGAILAIITAIILLIRNFDKLKNAAINAINNIKDRLSNSESFFARVLLTIIKLVGTFIKGIISFFKMLFSNVKLIFSLIKSIITGDFRGAFRAVTEIWGNIIGFFLELVLGIIQAFFPIVGWFKDKALDIVDKFKSIPSLLSDKFSNAVGRIKSVFSPLVDWFKRQTDRIKGFFSGIGDAASNAIGFAGDKVTGAVGWVGDRVSGAVNFGKGLIGHEDGGIFDKEHIANFAEGNKAEAIIPLTKPKRAKEILGKTMDILGIKSNSLSNDNLKGLNNVINKACSMLNNMNADLNQNVSNLYTSNDNSTKVVNNNFDMKSNYNINDVSGNGQSVAYAVDRTNQLRMRNLKGVLG